MEVQLSTCKRKLTNYCKKLESVASEARQQGSTTEEDYRTTQGRIAAVEICTKKVEEALQEYASALDKEANGASASELGDFEQYRAMAEATLSAAFGLTLQLHGRIRSWTSNGSSSAPQSTASESGHGYTTQEARRIDLPTLPIPKFAGSIWDWDNFWILFNANVHSQPIPALFKFNHLLSALKGEPLQAIMRFQITEANYQKAVDFLQAKYGDKEELMHHLIARLESATLNSPAIKEQRVLLDQLHVIISQLRDKGEQVDSQWLIKQVLSKFPERVQRKILERKCSMEEPFLMQNLLDTLDKYISSEEKIALFTSKEGSTTQQRLREERPTKGQSPRRTFPCMYCGQDHKAAACTKYATPQERANYLREHKLCFICASPQHTTAECRKRVCFACQGRHHTSCCFKFDNKTTAALPGTPPVARKDKPSPVGTKGRAKVSEKPDSTPQAAKQLSNHYHNQEMDRDEEEDDPVAEFHASESLTNVRETYLPIGELTVMDPSTRRLRRIPALLDSEAECSFIDQRLADELNLPTMSATTLRVRTFGSENELECPTRKVPLEIWDDNGEPHVLQLLTHTTLTSALRTPPILDEDVAFIEERKLKVNMGQARTVKPRILLGSDHLCQFIREDQAQVRLPSGLYLLPSRLGHLLTGQVQLKRQVAQVLIGGQRQNKTGSSRKQRRTLQVAIDERNHFLRPTEEAIMEQNSSKEAECSYETLARHLKLPKEHVDDKEALTKQLQERVNELHSQLERLEKEKEAQVQQLQETIKKLENQVDWLEKQKEANEIRDVPADDQAYGKRIAKEVNVHRQDVDNPEYLEMRSENSQEGVELEKERHLQDEGQQRRQQKRAFLRQRLQQLKKRTRAIRKGLRSIPERKREWQSPRICSTMEYVFCRKAGCHYSDSCPVVPDVSERRQILRKRGRCPRCMEHCERRGYCAYANKECFYCAKAKNTVFADCTPKDDRHHSALCSIPRRMQEAKRELGRLEDDIQHCQLELAH